MNADTQWGIEHLDVDRCRRLLRTHELARLAVRRDETVDIFPINYLVFDDRLYFRSAPGSKLAELAASPQVAFEIDGRSGRHLWSVVVHGAARRLSADEEIERSGIQTLRAAHPSEKNNFVMITPDSISGREFRGTARLWNSGSIVITGAIVVALIAVAGIIAEFIAK